MNAWMKIRNVKFWECNFRGFPFIILLWKNACQQVPHEQCRILFGYCCIVVFTCKQAWLTIYTFMNTFPCFFPSHLSLKTSNLPYSNFTGRGISSGISTQGTSRIAGRTQLENRKSHQLLSLQRKKKGLSVRVDVHKRGIQHRHCG